jgi:hypothetical protein
MCLHFIYKFRSKHCFIELRSRCEQNHMKLFMHSARYCCPILTQVGVCGQMLVKLLNINFREDLFCGSSGVIGGRTWEGYYFFKLFTGK